MNIGRTVRDNATRFSVTLQTSEGFDICFTDGTPTRIKPELGSAFGPILFPMNDAFLEALALDADQLLEWIDHYPIVSFEVAGADGPDDRIRGAGTRRGLEPTKDVN